MSFYAYIMASGRNGTLYTGSTDNLARRVYEHQERVRSGFASKYDCVLLVWFEPFDTREGAFKRERQIKEWKRIWKIELIEKINPWWRDLSETLV